MSVTNALTIQPSLSDISGSTITRDSLATPQKLPSIGSPSAISHTTTDSTNQIPHTPDHIIERSETSAVDKSEPKVEESTPREFGEIAEGMGNLQVDDTQPRGSGEDELQEQEGEDTVDGPASELEGDAGPPLAVAKELEVTDLPALATAEEAGILLAAAEVEVRLLDPEDGSYYVAEVILDVLNR